MRELEPGIVLHLENEATYGRYLRLDKILSAQQPRSGALPSQGSPKTDPPPSSRPMRDESGADLGANPHTVAHDEMLFIIQHQTSELWMKLMIHELDAARALVRQNRLEGTFKILARVGHIQRMLFEQWSVLETMTPSEYLGFRDALGKASGFQSYQYRAIEFALGNKDKAMLRPHAHDADIHGWLEARLTQPSLYDEFLMYLARKGMAVPKASLERDWSLPYERSAGVIAVFKEIYSDPGKHWAAYDMCEKLVDIEERFQLWRFRHVTTVKRIIGFKKGTGGSSGVGFLTKALEISFFPELWDVRTELGG
jgi:tryptophan 2,3-dioxygenase